MNSTMAGIAKTTIIDGFDVWITLARIIGGHNTVERMVVDSY